MLFETTRTDLQYCPTNKTTASIIDAVLVRRLDGVVIGIAETKCRTCDLDQFINEFKSEWLLTFEKILEARKISDALGVPFIGLLYLVPSDVLLMRRIYDPERGWVTPFRVEQTITQATVNGGSVVRANAFIDMRVQSVGLRPIPF